MHNSADFTATRDSDELDRIVATATENAKAKNARLRQLKERNEAYLAERRGEDETDEDQTLEL